MTLHVSVQKRTNETRAQLQQADMIPGVVYGPKQPTLPISISRAAFEKTFKEAGESTIISLQGLDEPVEVLVHQVDFHPTKPGFLHVDFYAIERGKDMTTEVPLEFVGESPIEKTGAMINRVLHEVTITCRPSNLPKHIEVDLTQIQSEEDNILVSALVVPEGVVIETDPEEVVAVTIAARSGEEDTDDGSTDISSIEVEEKGKADEAEN